MRYVMAASALAATLALAAPAAAQQPNRPVTGGDTSTVLVGAGVTFLDWGSTGVGGAANVLFNTLKVTGTGRIGVVGDLGLNHFDGGNALTALGGARYTFTTEGKIIPYGQFLVGVLHSPGYNDFVPALGFGADIAWKENLNFRGEVQFIFTDFDDATRWFFGVSLPVKK
jgi:hypothetical protein